tara:strand:+ start:732 stop:1400 length:669 start_codon:yes stop_codon:yes gene_type:complete
MANTLEYTYYNWGPFLFKTKITPEECQKLLEEGKKYRKKIYDHRARLAGHLTEEYKLDDMEGLLKWFNKYLKMYVNAFYRWKGYPNNSSAKLHLESIWINYMKSGDFNPPHTHGSDLSFVVYPSIPEKILEENKAFMGNRNPGGGPGGISFTYGSTKPNYISAVDHFPQTGDLFIFPADLTHWVFPFRSKVERVSVSGNLRFNPDNNTNNDIGNSIKVSNES